MAKILCHYFRDENRRKLLSTQKINLVTDCYFNYVLTFEQLVPTVFCTRYCTLYQKTESICRGENTCVHSEKTTQ